MRKKKVKAAGPLELNFDINPDLTPLAPAPCAYSISELNEKIKSLLNNSFSNDIWLYGEVYRYNLDIKQALTRNYGQVYFELVEQNPSSGRIEAAIPVMIWGKERLMIEKKLEESGGLRDGVQIKVKCTVDFYPKQGKLQLIIKDIDAEYTMGKIALARKKLLEKLKALGLLEKNKQVPMPLVPLRIGLITSYGSAAYNDFVDELKLSGYAFKVFVCDARMQGRDIQRDVIASLKTLNSMDIDAIAIIRGGGSASDLMGFDAEEIAVAIANSAKPVLTGIGHQIDRTVADEVASQALKTPTAIAQFLVEKARSFEKETDSMFQQILELQMGLIEENKGYLKDVFSKISAYTKGLLKSNNAGLDSLLGKICSESGHAIEKQYLGVNRLVEKQAYALNNVFSRGKVMLDNFEKQAESRDPIKIIKKGYSVIYNAEKKVIKSISQVNIGDSINAVVFDGTIESTIDKKIKE